MMNWLKFCENERTSCNNRGWPTRYHRQTENLKTNGKCCWKHQTTGSIKSMLIIITLCIVCYYNALDAGFVFDDISAIKENKDLHPETPITNVFRNDFWGLPMDNERSHKSYRPLCILTFRINYWLHQLRPYGYHLVNVVFHVIVSILFLRFCQLIMDRPEHYPESSSSSFFPKPSLLAAILFSVHPIHTEAVTSLVGRAETLSAFFFLLAIMAYREAATQSTTNWPMFTASIIAVAAGTFSKEQGITAVAICLLVELFLLFDQKPRQNRSIQWLWILARKMVSFVGGGGDCPKWIKEMMIRILLLLTFTVAMLAIRMGLMRWQLPVFTKFDNPAVYAPTPIRQLTNNYLYALNVWLLINPWNLCCDWTMSSIPLIETFFGDLRNLSTITFYLITIFLIRKSITTKCIHCSRIISTSMALMIIPFIPASNIFFPVGFVLAERVLYIPSFGFCMLIAHGITTLMVMVVDRQRPSRNNPNGPISKKYYYILLLAIFFLIVFHSLRTIRRNEDWNTEQKIFWSGIRVNDRNAKLYNNLGHVYEARGEYDQAMAYFRQAAAVQPDDVGAYTNIARIHNHLRQFDEAERYYSRARDVLMEEIRQTPDGNRARIAPGHLSIFIKLANLIARHPDRLPEADALYRQVIKMRTDYVEAYINRGDILLRMNRTRDADAIYKMALSYDDQNADIYYNLGVVAIYSKKLDEAIHYFDRAVKLNPDHNQAQFNFAIVVQDAKRPELYPIAMDRLRRLSIRDPQNERIYFNMAMIEMALGHFPEAERWFRRTLQLRPQMSSANFNLALLLVDAERPMDALPFLHRLLADDPGHVKGLILMGDIQINVIKDYQKASECYHRILARDPRNIQAKHNLCVVLVEQDRLADAERCLDEAVRIAPDQNYIDRHLKIVRLRLLKKKQQKL